MKRILCLILPTAMLFCSLAHAEEPLQVSAVSCVLMEADTGEVLYEKSMHEKRAMASITKIMTALLTIESGNLDSSFTVDSEAIKVEGTSMGLREGDIVTKRALCYGMLLPSGNDAANAAAVEISGSFEAFSELMNKKAAELGMENTHFVTPSGLDADGHYTTAYDMALLTKAALENPIFAEICSTKKTSLEYGNPVYKRWLTNSNKMLSMYDGAIGVKTGFTDNAGRTLVSAARRDGVTLICVTLFDRDDWNDHTNLLDYGFSRVKKQSYNYSFDAVTVDVVGGTKASVRAEASGTAMISAVDGKIPDGIEMSVCAEHFCYAPVTTGDSVGRLDFCRNGVVLASVELTAAEDVPAAQIEEKDGIFEKILNFFRRLR